MLSDSVNCQFLGIKSISINLVKLPFPQIKFQKCVQKNDWTFSFNIPYHRNLLYSAEVFVNVTNAVRIK